DPEWNMGPEGTPGQRIGSMDASTINYAIDQLAKLVDEHDLPPKILIVHRFTRDMVRNPEQIKDDPRVQVVLNMDGWGAPTLKLSSYDSCVAPVGDVHKGFKLFFKNDTRDGSRLMTPSEVLSPSPKPIYIQYQGGGRGPRRGPGGLVRAEGGGRAGPGVCWGVGCPAPPGGRPG